VSPFVSRFVPLIHPAWWLCHVPTARWIVLVVVGAILEFAVTVKTSGFNIHTVGVILLTVGIVAFVVSAIMIAVGGMRRTSIHEDIRNTPAGRQRDYEERDHLAS